MRWPKASPQIPTTLGPGVPYTPQTDMLPPPTWGSPRAEPINPDCQGEPFLVQLNFFHLSLPHARAWHAAGMRAGGGILQAGGIGLAFTFLMGFDINYKEPLHLSAPNAGRVKGIVPSIPLIAWCVFLLSLVYWDSYTCKEA